jgi:hypothetical protein
MEAGQSAGQVGEQTVVAVLERLREQGCDVLHDVRRSPSSMSVG